MSFFKTKVLDVFKSERTLNLLGIGTALLLLLLFFIVILYGPGLRANTGAIKDGTDLQGCRSQHSAPVTDARTDLDVAKSERDRAASQHTLTQTAITKEALFGNETAVAPLLVVLERDAAAVEEANATVVEKEQAYSEANATYQKAIDISLNNPAAFLATCRGETP
jgi:hypothetical protein